MTTRPIARPSTPPLGEFPEPPPREDMQNFDFLHKPSHPSALDLHFSGRDAMITGEAPLGWRAGRGVDFVVPDLLIAFGADARVLRAQNGYSINHQGKPPDFVLEVASVSTARNDYTSKRVDYAAFGIPEYWRFDPTGGRRHDAPLAGDTLVDGVYRPIEIIQRDESHLWGHSQVLDLDLCWENGELNWWDPAAGSYFSTYEEHLEARMAAEARVRELEAELERRRNL